MLQIEGLCKAYGDRPLLQALNLQIAAGEIYGLLGPNGAGKTTTINLICGLLQADAGKISLQGQPISARTKGLIGVVPQENLLYRSLTCAENLAFFARIYGLSPAAQRQQVRACLQAVNLSDRAHSPVDSLSGGMQRRLSLAVALVHQPRLVILDEPTTGLDIEARYEVWQLIRTLQRQGMTLLLTTHLLEEAERLCQRIGILKQGKLLAEGTLPQLRQRIPAKEIVILETSDEAAAIQRGKQHGFQPRRYGSDLAFWMPEVLDLRAILDCFADLPIDSVARQPVKLEHIYVEVTRDRQPRSPRVPEPPSTLIGSN